LINSQASLNQEATSQAFMAASPNTSPSLLRVFDRPLVFVLIFLANLSLWLLFAASLSGQELLLGTLISLASLVFILYISQFIKLRFELRFRDIIQAWRIPWYIISGFYEITIVLFKDLLHLSPAKSLFRVCGFDTSSHDPIREARTILAIAYTTVGSTFIVIGIDPAQSRMLFHQIEASDVPIMTRSLGAKS
jgi:multisubunit Na+/H+ antiporter MnhE subunit